MGYQVPPHALSLGLSSGKGSKCMALPYCRYGMHTTCPMHPPACRCMVNGLGVISVSSLSVEAQRPINWSLKFLAPRATQRALAEEEGTGLQINSTGAHFDGAHSSGISSSSGGGSHRHHHHHSASSSGHKARGAAARRLLTDSRSQGGSGPTESRGQLNSTEGAGGASHRRQAAQTKKGLRILVVRPRMPDGCAGGAAGGCSAQMWRAVLQGSNPFAALNMLSTCTWGGISVASLDVTPDIPVPCIPPQDTCDRLYGAIHAAVDNLFASTGQYDLGSYDHVSMSFSVPELKLSVSCLTPCSFLLAGCHTWPAEASSGMHTYIIWHAAHAKARTLPLNASRSSMTCRAPSGSSAGSTRRRATRAPGCTWCATATRAQ